MADGLFTVIVDDSQLRRAAATLRLKATQGFIPAMSRLLRRRLTEGVRALTYNVTGGVLRRRTGNLARQIAFTVQEQGTERVIGRFGVIKEGPALAYAGIHLTGGIIRPTHGQYLAVPLRAAQTASGVTRFAPRSVPGAFFIRSKLGNLLLVRRRAGGLEPLFLMKREVRIPRRDYWSGPRDLVVRTVTEDAALLLKDELRIQ